MSGQIRTDERHYELYIAASKTTVRLVAQGFVLGIIFAILLHVYGKLPLVASVFGASSSFALLLGWA